MRGARGQRARLRLRWLRHEALDGTFLPTGKTRTGEEAMIAFLDGCVAGKAAPRAVIEVGGVGYELLMSDHSLAALPDEGSSVRVITYLSVSESSICLYGFMEQAEEALFRNLIGVSGIGPKMALAALSAFTPQELEGAIASEDIKAISKIPGIGKKTASRMVLELKGTLPQAASEDASKGPEVCASSALKDAVQALGSMGFTKAEIDAALVDAPSSEDAQTLLQYALKRIV